MAKSALPSNAIYLALGAGALYVIYKSGVLQNVSQGVGDIGSGIGSGVSGIGQGLGSGVSQIGGGVLALGAGLGSGLSGLGQGIGGGVYNVGSGFEDVGLGFMNLQTEVGDGFKQLLAGLGNVGANINTPWGNIKVGANANANANNSNVTGNNTVIPSTNSDKQVNSNTANITAKTAVYGTIANEFGGYSPTINGVQQLQSIQAPTNAPKSASVKQAVIVTPVSQTQTYALGQQYLSAVLNNRGPTSLR